MPNEFFTNIGLKSRGSLMNRFSFLFLNFIFFFQPVLRGVESVTNESQLDAALRNQADTEIRFDANISISTQNIFPVNSNIAFTPNSNFTLIDGNGFTLDAPSDVFRGFFVHGGTITIQNLTFSSLTSKGGQGGDSQLGGRGGGGAGMGGGLFVDTGVTINLENCSFANCSAEGGDGGTNPGIVNSAGGGGGGGFLGGGGNCSGDMDLSNGGAGGGGFYATQSSIRTGGDATSNGGGGGGAGGGGALGGVGGTAQLTLAGGGGFPHGGGAGGTFRGGGGGASDSAAGSDASGGTGGSGGTGTFPGADGGDGGGSDGGGGGGSATQGSDGTTPDGGNGGNGTSDGHGGGGGGSYGSDDGSGGNGGYGGLGGGGGGGGYGGASTAVNAVGGDGGDFGGGGGGAAPISRSSTDGIAAGGTGGFAAGGGGGGFLRGNDPLGAGQGDGGNAGFGGGGGGAGRVFYTPNGTASGGTAIFGGNGGPSQSLYGGGGGGGSGLGGGIFIRDGGTVNFIGSLSFSGDSVTAGASGGDGADPGLAHGIDIFAMAGANMNFNLTSDVTIPNPIEGDLGAGGGSGGGLMKSGSATLALTGANTYTDTTTVNEGTLRINGSVISDIEVSGGTLTGNFDVFNHVSLGISGDIRLNSGRFEPGNNGVGTVTVAGEFIHNDGTFAVDITPDPLNADVVMVTTSATINGGNIEVFLGSGNYIEGTVYTVIEGPTSGTIYSGANIIKAGPAANVVDIDVRFGSLQIVILSTSLFHDHDITSEVAQEVYKCIISEPIVPGSDFAYVVQLLGTFSNVDPYLELLAPTQFGSLEWINAWNQSLVAEVLSDHLLDLCCTNRDCCDPCANSTFWIAGYGNWADQHKKLDNLKPFDASSGGVVAGIDHCCNNWIFGGAVGYTHTSFDWKHHLGDGDINSYYGALYGSWTCNCLAVDMAFIGGGSDQHVSRKISFPGLSRKAKSDPWGYFFTAHLGGRYTWDCECFSFEPFALADYHYFNRESFKEHGADSINLNVKSHTQHFIRGEAGMRLSYIMRCDCFCFAPYIGASWVGDFPINDSDQKANFRGRSCVMDIEAYDDSIQLGSPEMGFRLTYDCGPSMLVGYKGLFGKKDRINQIDIRFEWAF